MKNSLYPLGLGLAMACTEPHQKSLSEDPCFQYVDTSNELLSDTTYPGQYPHKEADKIQADIRNLLGLNPLEGCANAPDATLTTRIFGAYDWSFLPKDGPVRSDSWIHLDGPSKECFYHLDPTFSNYTDGAAFTETVVARFEEALDCVGY